MIPENNHYPLFEVNQVLSASHLNTLHDRLDEQNRLTRATLHGIGIVCGLEVSAARSGGNATITISKGYGVTSAGYALIIGDGGFQADRCRKLTIADDYEPLLADEEKESGLLELLDSGHELYNDDESSPIDAGNLSGMAVMLYVELLETSLKTCTPGSCDDQGTTVTERVRKLLVPTAFLDSLHQRIAGTIVAKGDFFPDRAARLDLPDIGMPRFDVPATALSGTGSILAAYKTMLADPLDDSGKSLFTRIGEALDAAREAFGPLLDDKGDAFIERLEAIGKRFLKPKAAAAASFQYFYDFLKDLIDAYDEFRSKALELTSLCNPPSALFARHLELGELEAAPPATPSGEAGTLIYRHDFRPSPALGELAVRSRQVQSLYGRLQAMVDRFEPPAQSGNTPWPANARRATIRVTPGRTAGSPLSERPIPCYYDIRSSLLKTWDFSKTAAGKAGLNHGYGIPGDALITTSLDRCGFFRIEGHLGLDRSEALETLQKQIARYRLPFEVLVVKAETAPEDANNEELQGYLPEFVKQHPGISHDAGVLPGGTFVMVCHSKAVPVLPDDPFREVLMNLRLNTIVADFSLPYRFTAAQPVTGVPVGECDYHWIDSIRHLNNITLREYRLQATPKARAAHEQERNRLASNYVVRIKRYEIQGKNLIAGHNHVDVTVPLSELKNYGHAAIMNKLNETFPLGLVFDHTAGTGNVLLRFAEGQRFRIELEGVQGNRIRYAYTHEGMYRFQNDLWEQIGGSGTKSSCRMIATEYDEKVYRWIQKTFRPNATQRTITRPSVQELVKWEKLTLKRARRYKTAEKLPIYKTVLTGIVSAIKSIDPDAKIVLSGSWANGSWLSRIESENIESFGSVTQLNAFRTLNRKVTGKTGFSGIDLLIDSQYDITTAMIPASSGYQVTIYKGKKDAQKGLEL